MKGWLFICMEVRLWLEFQQLAEPLVWSGTPFQFHKEKCRVLLTHHRNPLKPSEHFSCLSQSQACVLLDRQLSLIGENLSPVYPHSICSLFSAWLSMTGFQQLHRLSRSGLALLFLFGNSAISCIREIRPFVSLCAK